MESNDFIKRLSLGLKPIRPLPRPRVRFVYWLSASVFATGATLFYLGVRSDIKDAMSDWEFIIQNSLLLLMSVMAALGAFIMSVPGERQSKHRWYVPLILGGVLATILVVSTCEGYNQGNMRAWFPGSGFSCLVSMAILSAFPGTLLFVMLRRAAPLQLSVSGCCAFLAVTSMASLSANIHCAGNVPMHILVWHFLPVLAMALVGGWLGRWLLRWDAKTTS